MQNRNLSRAVVIDVETDALNAPLEVSLNETSVRLFVRPSDEFEELMNSLNFTRRGRFTWSLGIYNNERKAMRFFARYAKDFIPHSMISIMPYTATYCSNIVEGYRSGNLHSVGMTVLADSRRLTAALADFPNFVAPNLNYSDSYNEERNDIQTNQYHYYRLTRRPNEVNPIDEFYRKYSTIGGVSVEVKNGVLWVRVFVAQDIAEEYKDVIDMRTLKNVSRSRPVPLTPRVAKKTLMSINEKYENFCVDLDGPVQELLDASDDVVCIGYLPNNPASVVLARGENVGAKTLSQLARYNKGQDYEVTLKTALRLREKNSSTNFLVHPGLSDMVNMTLAQPYQGDARLYEFQKEAIGLHLSTQIGYLNSCEPGCGKTVMQLVAMKARAETINNYRGLIVVEANARHQWQEEAAVWFPQAQVYALSAGSAIDDLSEAMAKKGPVIIIVSYAQTLLAHEERERRIKFAESLKTMTFNEKMKALQEQPADNLEVGSLLLNTYWNDICADEATVVRNASSKQNSIMWTLRNNSQVAVALTGTPINKSADDLARLVSWTRNDKTMFSGLPLSERYDTASEKGAKELYDIFSTLAFRRDSSVVEGNMPEVQTSVIHLQPTTAEKALANAAERELRRCYLELEAAINGVSADENISEQEIAAAKEELAAARGAWLGGKQLSRLANSDPAALLASESPGAALLMAQGLVEQAMLNTPTKRAFYVQEMKKRVLAGQKIVTFTEFSSVAKILVEALVAEGINAKPYMGSNRTVRDQYRQEFQAGNIDVLVCTSAAERGLTLHRAKTIVHYDLPWKAERVVQRTGRGRRIGSQHDVLDVLYMVMSGGIEERIAESIVYGSVAAAMVLDHSRGVDIRRTQSVSALGGLMQDVTSKNLEKFEDFGRIFMKGEKAA